MTCDEKIYSAARHVSPDMILDEIVANKRAEIAKRRQRVSLAELQRRAESLESTRDFANALRGGCVALIAEIKRMSPSRGALSPERHSKDGASPLHLARAYAANGAAAISVLTDKKHFNGSPSDLKAVRAATQIPILRKDFIVDEYQIYESRALQADAILLIVRMLSDAQLHDFLALTDSFGMHALVEVHDERELERALAADADIIGINNRNLADFTVDLRTTERLAPQIPREKRIIAESGIFARVDVERAAHAGAHAVLVGEALMRAEDVGAKVQELSSVKRKT